MYDISDLRPTIIPKSDQLNSEQLLGGPITVTVTDVTIGSSDEQPISVHYEGERGRPFKPCKTMRKVLIFAWGPDGREWIGRSMTLYNDPQVKFGGAEVGGIRISHMTDIDRDIQVSLTATKGKKAMHVIRRMESMTAQHASAIRNADTLPALKEAFAAAYKSTKDPARRDAFKRAYDERTAALTKPEPTFEITIERIESVHDIAGLQMLADDVEAMPAGPEREALLAAIAKRDKELAQ